jgi:hypothetical protein
MNSFCNRNYLVQEFHMGQISRIHPNEELSIPYDVCWSVLSDLRYSTTLKAPTPVEENLLYQPPLDINFGTVTNNLDILPQPIRRILL